MSNSRGDYEYAELGGNWVVGCGGMSSLTSIKNWDFSFTKDFDGLYLTNDYWIGLAWRMFGGCNSLTDVTFTGTIHIFDELNNYQILKALRGTAPKLKYGIPRCRSLHQVKSER